MPAAEELTTSAAEPGAAAESASQRPALRRTRPPMAELAAVRAPGSTRRTLLYAVGSLVAVWLTFVALRPEWVLPVGRPEATPPPPRPGAARLPDSLPWMVQVSAWNDLAHALEAMDTLAARGVRALVTPIRVDKGISYRVQAGPFATMGQAELVLDTLRAHSLADPDGSVAVPLPLSFVLGGRVGTAAADVHVERDSLRAAGVAAFLLAEPGGRLRLYAGAFERPDEAQVLDSILFTLGRARRLGPRVGLLP